MSFKIKFKELLLRHQLKINRQITMSEIAAETGVSRPQLSKLKINPTENTTIRTIEKLCIFFNCSLDDMIEFDPPLKKDK